MLRAVAGEHDEVEAAGAGRVRTPRWRRWPLAFALRARVVGGGEEGVERPLMEQASLTTEELALDLVADEGVTEAEAVVGRLLQQPGAAARRTSRSSASSMSAARASTSKRVVGPQIAAASSTRRSTAASPSSWLHRLFQGPGQAGAQEVARADVTPAPGGGRVSSMKNGLPPVRL